MVIALYCLVFIAVGGGEEPSIETCQTCFQHCSFSWGPCLGWRAPPSCCWRRSPRSGCKVFSAAIQGSAPPSPPCCSSKRENRCRSAEESRLPDRQNVLQLHWHPWSHCADKESSFQWSSGWRGRRWWCHPGGPAACLCPAAYPPPPPPDLWRGRDCREVLRGRPQLEPSRHSDVSSCGFAPLPPACNGTNAAATIFLFVVFL